MASTTPASDFDADAIVADQAPGYPEWLAHQDIVDSGLSLLHDTLHSTGLLLDDWHEPHAIAPPPPFDDTLDAELLQLDALREAVAAASNIHPQGTIDPLATTITAYDSHFNAPAQSLEEALYGPDALALLQLLGDDTSPQTDQSHQVSVAQRTDTDQETNLPPRRTSRKRKRAQPGSRADGRAAATTALAASARRDASAAAADRVEIARLLRMRQRLVETRMRNATLQALNRRLARNVREARIELAKMKEALDVAAALGNEEDEPIVISPHDTRVGVPRFPKLVQSSPTLQRELQELQDYRQLLQHSPWTSSDVACLRKTVLSACRRMLTLRLVRAGRYHRLEELVPREDHELMRVSWDPQAYVADDAVGRAADEELRRLDWEWVAESVAGYTAEECRTRWLMVERHELLRQREQGRAKPSTAAAAAAAAQQGGRRNVARERERRKRQLGEALGLAMAKANAKQMVSWEDVAEEVKIGMTGSALASALMVSHQPPPVEFLPGEDRDICAMHVLWGNWWAIIGERLGARRTTENIRSHYSMVLKEVPEGGSPGQWTAEQDAELWFQVLRMLDVEGSSSLARQLFDVYFAGIAPTSNDARSPETTRQASLATPAVSGDTRHRHHQQQHVPRHPRRRARQAAAAEIDRREYEDALARLAWEKVVRRLARRVRVDAQLRWEEVGPRRRWMTSPRGSQTPAGRPPDGGRRGRDLASSGAARPTGTYEPPSGFLEAQRTARYWTREMECRLHFAYGLDWTGEQLADFCGTENWAFCSERLRKLDRLGQVRSFATRPRLRASLEARKRAFEAVWSGAKSKEEAEAEEIQREEELGESESEVEDGTLEEVEIGPGSGRAPNGVRPHVDSSRPVNGSPGVPPGDSQSEPPVMASQSGQGSISSAATPAEPSAGTAAAAATNSSLVKSGGAATRPGHVAGQPTGAAPVEDAVSISARTPATSGTGAPVTLQPASQPATRSARSVAPTSRAQSMSSDGVAAAASTSRATTTEMTVAASTAAAAAGAGSARTPLPASSTSVTRNEGEVPGASSASSIPAPASASAPPPPSPPRPQTGAPPPRGVPSQAEAPTRAQAPPRPPPPPPPRPPKRAYPQIRKTVADSRARPIRFRCPIPPPACGRLFKVFGKALNHVRSAHPEWEGDAQREMELSEEQARMLERVDLYDPYGVLKQRRGQERGEDSARPNEDDGRRGQSQGAEGQGGHEGAMTQTADVTAAPAARAAAASRGASQGRGPAASSPARAPDGSASGVRRGTAGRRGATRGATSARRGRGGNTGASGRGGGGSGTNGGDQQRVASSARQL